MWIYDYSSPNDNPYREPPFAQITHMSYIDNAPQWIYPWHDHRNNFELGFILSGEGTIYVGDESSPVSEGSLVLIPPNIYHHYVTEENGTLTYYTLRFQDSPAENDLICFFRELGSSITSGINYLSYIQETFHILLLLHHSNGGIANGAFQSIALSLLQWVRLLFENSSLTLRINTSYGISDILEYIQTHQADKITLDFLSHHFGISPSNLNRLFNRAYHTSPINYLLYCRVTSATEYLLKTNYSVEEIAEKVGYQNPKHFINMFTTRIGYTPDEYRKKNKKIPLS